MKYDQHTCLPRLSFSVLFTSLCLSLSALNCYATDADLAKKLANPVADIIHLAFQLNYDSNIAATETIKPYQLNIQPVIPNKLNDNWKVISRTILSVVYPQYEGLAIDDDWSTADLTQSFLFTPNPKITGSTIIGFGPVIFLPNTPEKTLGADQYGLRPTLVLAKQIQSNWTYAAFTHHIWVVGKKDGDTGINNTFLQPFLNYITPTSMTWPLNTEINKDIDARLIASFIFQNNLKEIKT